MASVTLDKPQRAEFARLEAQDRERLRREAERVARQEQQRKLAAADRK